MPAPHVHLIDLLEVLVHEAVITLEADLEALLYSPGDVAPGAVLEPFERASFIARIERHPIGGPRLTPEAEPQHGARVQVGLMISM